MSALEEAERRAPGDARVLLARARVKDFDGEPGVLEVVEQAVAADPKLAEARVFRAELLEQEDFEGAARHAEAILGRHPRRRSRRCPSSPPPATCRATPPASRTRGARRSSRIPAARSRQPARRAERAQPPLRRGGGVRRAGLGARSPLLARAGLLGLNQILRIGAMDEGRRNLEVSFKGDPYNVWIKNTLDLLDTLPQYRETGTANFRLVVHGKESESLAPLVGELAEEAYAALSGRYRHRPAAPIRLEVYPSHGDFSVRTVGIAGLGALGVSFGRVLAVRLALRAAHRAVQLGLDALARGRPRGDVGGDRRQDPALARRGAVRARGAARPPGVGRRRDGRVPARARRETCCRCPRSTTGSRGRPARSRSRSRITRRR